MTRWEDALSKDLRNVVKKSPKTFYEVLKIAPNTQSEQIEQLWTQRKNKEMSIEERAAFSILLQSENRDAYDKLLENKENNDALYMITCEHNRLLDDKQWLIVQKERNRANQLKDLVEKATKPEEKNQDMIQFIKRFYQNDQGYWVEAKITPDEMKKYRKYQVDILKMDNTYLYHINDLIDENLIASNDYFEDYNKPTSRFGYQRTSHNASETLRNNLTGYFWEITKDWETNKNIKLEYFQNYYGNQYVGNNLFHYRKNGSPILLRTTFLEQGKICVPNNLVIQKEMEDAKIYCDLTDFYNYQLFGNQITYEQEQTVLEDVKNTNPDDLQTIKRILAPIYEHDR